MKVRRRISGHKFVGMIADALGLHGRRIRRIEIVADCRNDLVDVLISELVDEEASGKLIEVLNRYEMCEAGQDES